MLNEREHGGEEVIRSQAHITPGQLLTLSSKSLLGIEFVEDAAIGRDGSVILRELN
jgi:hypothetical protein